MQYEHFEIPCCRTGTLTTLALMADLVHASLLDPVVRQKSLELVSGSQNPGDLAQSIQRFIRLAVTIVDEPDEMLHRPEWIIRQINEKGYTFGDCDDVAMLSAALLAAAGIPVRFKAIGPAPDGSMEHVFTEWSGSAGWTALDPTIDFYPVYGAEFLVQDVA